MSFVLESLSLMVLGVDLAIKIAINFFQKTLLQIGFQLRYAVHVPEIQPATQPPANLTIKILFIFYNYLLSFQIAILNCACAKSGGGGLDTYRGWWCAAPLGSGTDATHLPGPALRLLGYLSQNEVT